MSTIQGYYNSLKLIKIANKKVIIVFNNIKVMFNMEPIKDSVTKELKAFLSETSIHGLKNITINDSHKIIKGIWLVLWLISCGYSVSIIQRNIEGKLLKHNMGSHNGQTTIEIIKQLWGIAI